MLLIIVLLCNNNAYDKYCTLYCKFELRFHIVNIVILFCRGGDTMLQ